MIIYNPHNENILRERIKEAQLLLNEIPAKYCFITGSFLYKKKYKDIDIFVVTRSKKRISCKNKKATITVIDFNNLYSLFYHSISKSCVAKSVLPTKPIKATLSEYWEIINEAVPTLINQKNKYHKAVRFLVLYTEFFKNKEILDTFQLDKKIKAMTSYTEILGYIAENVPKIMHVNRKKSYLQRFFYTQAGIYKEIREYSAQRFLYNLSHEITRGCARG